MALIPIFNDPLYAPVFPRSQLAALGAQPWVSEAPLAILYTSPTPPPPPPSTGDDDYMSETGNAAVGLNAVTATGDGPVILLPNVFRTHGIQIGATGSPTTVTATLKGSIDLTNYFTIATWDTGAGQTLGDIIFAVSKPVRALKVNLGTLSGGSSPAVTAWVSSAP